MFGVCTQLGGQRQVDVRSRKVERAGGFCNRAIGTGRSASWSSRLKRQVVSMITASMPTCSTVASSAVAIVNSTATAIAAGQPVR